MKSGLDAKPLFLQVDMLSTQAVLSLQFSFTELLIQLYIKCSKNSFSWNIKAPKYPFFNDELKFLVQNFHSQFFKQSIFEASEAPKQWEGIISKKRRLFYWVSRNFELEATWISLIGWPHKTSIICTVLLIKRIWKPNWFLDLVNQKSECTTISQ